MYDNLFDKHFNCTNLVKNLKRMEKNRKNYQFNVKFTFILINKENKFTVYFSFLYLIEKVA